MTKSRKIQKKQITRKDNITIQKEQNRRVLKDSDLKPFMEDLSKKGYDELHYEGTGNWGEVYRIYHKDLKCERAVKILLPKHAENKAIREDFLSEAEKMIKLTHNHIVNIFDLGAPDEKPYYIMEYVKSKNLREFLATYTDLSRDEYLEILKQICNVLSYIHSNNIVHLDIKAENIMVDRDLIGKGIKLADFGLAHYYVGSPAAYTVDPDIPWIPKSIAEFRKKRVPREKFRPSQDLAYFGKMLEDLPYDKYVADKFSDRQRTLLAKTIYDLREEHFESAEDLSKKLLKMSPTHPSTGGIPEIAASQAIDSSNSIRIPRQTIVPLTNRILKLIELPEMQRLRRIKQLGPTSLIYPGASHTRFEHSLGAYSIVLEYLSYLLGDPEFDYLLDEKHLVALLVGVLLHDIGHYPFAHQLEELYNSKFPPHRDVTRDLICGKVQLPNRSPKYATISDILVKHFKITPDDVAKLIKTTHTEVHLTKQEQVLASFLSGALDVDKQDYLVRDGLHAGVEYARHMDKARLLRSLTISLKYSELAVTEKGKVAVEFLIMSRSAMFSEVYWHHTNRAATAMIQRAFNEYLKYKKPSRSDLFKTLLTMSDDEILKYIVEQGPAHNRDLIPYPHKWTVRQVYKRVLTFASHYKGYKEEIYDKLIKLREKEIKLLENKIIKELNKKRPSLKIQNHEIILDIPIGEEKLKPVQIVYPNTPQRDEISLKDITHFSSTVFDQFFKHTKKARVFCHPRLRDDLREFENFIREKIAITLDVSIPIE